MKFFNEIKSCFFFCLFIHGATYCQNDANFIQLNKPFNIIQTIEQDSLGYIWISSNLGIYKYDGYNYFLTPNKDLFKNSTPQSTISATLIDSNKNYWLSTTGGDLTKIDKNHRISSYKDELRRGKDPINISTFIETKKEIWMGGANGEVFKYNDITSKIDSITSLPYVNGFSQKINNLEFINPNNLWISTIEGNLYKYSVDTSKLLYVDNSIRKLQSINIATDNNSRLWMATELDGLFLYDTVANAFKKFKDNGILKSNAKHPFFSTIFCDRKGNIWLGTDGDGLYKIDSKTQEVSNFKNEKTNQLSLNSNTIIKIYQDSTGNLWFIGKKNKISILPIQNTNINYYYGSENNSPTSILSILKSSDGSLWFGTDGEGINRVFPDNKEVQYNNTKKGIHYFEGKYVNKLLEDSKGNIWISTYQHGLWIYNPNLKKFSKVKLTYSDEKYAINVGVLFKDSKNRIWTTFNGEVDSSKKIYVFSEEQKLLASFDYQSNGLLGKGLGYITQDEFGTIWFGVTNGGLFEFSENTKNLEKSFFVKHGYMLDGKDFFESHDIATVLPDNRGHLYLITSSGFFLKYGLKNGEFQSFINNPNFKEVRFNSILIENKNNLWFGSLNGIHHYNTEKDELTSYNQADGFQNKSFRLRCAYKDAQGMLYFGGEFGVNSFLPSQIHKNTVQAKLYINDIEILNKPAKTIIPEQFNTRVEAIKKIELKSNQSSFSFWFSAISNNLSSDYHYAYRLRGFDDQWIEPKKEGIAIYTNIPHGHYTFEVKAGTKQLLWDISPIKLDIVITPPWWLSNVAYISYILALLLIVYAISVWAKLKSKLHKEELKYNSEKELYALKMNFFAKMSHEIQTPLTLILGPINDMLNRANANSNEVLRNRLIMIKNNANRLSRIAQELMTLRNKELGKLRVYASENDIIAHLKEIALSFMEQSKFKNISFFQELPKDKIIMWYDHNKIEHVIYNLLSNAFKFTPINSKVTLKVTFLPSDKQVEITVSDSGPGIPESELDRIFEFLYQSDLGKQKKGVGIGLALAKELVELHHGSINVLSSPDTGTSFLVRLSTDESLFAENEKIIVEDSKSLTKEVETHLNLTKEADFITKKAVKKTHKLLIVEDNVDMQIFLRDVFNEDYNLYFANNGKDGVSLAKNNNPDLIISDIMMPVMDGIEMSKILKSKKHTRHIPIILLTAENTSKGKLLGLKSGAVEYLKKPFNIYELLLKVNNIISTKEHTINKYKIEQSGKLEEDDRVKSKDVIFIENLTKEFNKQIYNHDFKLEDLSKSMNMSYSVIYRNCYNITGKTPLEFVKKLKLKRGAILILKEGYNISETAYMVGYRDPNYFTKSFKDEFGLTPAALKKEAKKVGIEVALKNYNIEIS